MKMRVNRGQELVIGGYTHGTKAFDSLIFGYYEGDKLIYVARTRNGFTPARRAQLFRRFRGLEIREYAFANLLESRPAGDSPARRRSRAGGTGTHATGSGVAIHRSR